MLALPKFRTPGTRRRFLTAAWIALALALLAAGLGHSGCGDDSGLYGTSAAWAADSRQATETAQRLSDAVVSHLSEDGDPAEVQNLVEPSAHDDLARMLSLLARPTGYTVKSVSGTESGPIDVDLVFADCKSQQHAFTLTIAVGPDGSTITAVKPTPPAVEPTQPVQPTQPYDTRGPTS